MYFAEHKFLGDTTKIAGDGPTEKVEQLQLENGLVVSYGEVNGFAGDHFGQETPISAEKDVEKMKATFQRWFNLLAASPDGKAKAEALRAELKPLNEKAEAVLYTNGTADQLASVYQKSPLDIWKLNDVSKRWTNGATFNQLLETNADHFGLEARAVYNAGHALAIDHAQVTYASPGFRSWKLLPSAVINGSANIMHEEDGAWGVWVRSPSGEKWKAFGDGRLPGQDSSSKAMSTNLSQCRKALDQSVKEILDASRTKQSIPQTEFAAWRHAPMIEAISADSSNHLPLLKVQGDRIWYRTGGAKSAAYKEIQDFFDWMSFYKDNMNWIDGQIKLVINKTFGLSL